MKTRHIQISDDVRAVLERSVITATSVTLPQGERLQPPLYKAVNTVLENAGGKWNKKAQAHLFTGDPREALGLALTTGKIVNKQQTLQAFYTPDELAHKLAQYLDITPGEWVLEPSAGRGALVKAARAAGGKVKAIDIDPESAKVCSTLTPYPVLQSDFLAFDPVEFPSRYDAVMMNPPFTNDQDIAHVTHALRFLRTEGRLAAIMSPRFISNKNDACTRFRRLVKDRDAQIIDVPAGTFRASGTNVATVIVLFNCKPV